MGCSIAICPPSLAEDWTKPLEHVGMSIAAGPPGAKLEALPDTFLDLVAIVRTNGYEAQVWMDASKFVRHPLCKEGGGYNLLIVGRDNGKSAADHSLVVRLYWALCARGLRGLTWGYTLINDVRSPVGELARGGISYRVLTHDILSRAAALPAGCSNAVGYSSYMRHEVHWGPSLGLDGPTQYVAFRTNFRLPFLRRAEQIVA